MKSQGILALLLVSAGGLIYAATHQTRDTMQSNRRGGDAPLHVARPTDPTSGGPYFAADSLDQRVDRLLDKAVHDQSSYRDTYRFVCKLPAEVGPVPLLDAVDAYLRGTPESRRDPALLGDLRRAAQHGNWLAKVQVALSQGRRAAPDDASVFRAITLEQWMGERRIGALYAAVADAAGTRDAQRARPARMLSSLDLYAAMHHNYPSQYKVGRELLRGGDPRQAAIGRRMLDCAARALPAYRHPDEDRALAAR